MRKKWVGAMGGRTWYSAVTVISTLLQWSGGQRQKEVKAAVRSCVAEQDDVAAVYGCNELIWYKHQQQMCSITKSPAVSMPVLTPCTARAAQTCLAARRQDQRGTGTLAAPVAQGSLVWQLELQARVQGTTH